MKTAVLTGVLLLPSILWAGVDDAVVMIGGCSGVCVDPAGLVLTAKHCDLPQTVEVRFKERTVTATRVLACRDTEGPVVYDCEGSGYPHLPVAATPPRVGDRVWSFGYPHRHGTRELREASGPLLQWGSFQYAGGSFHGNVVRFGTCAGWSGGPLINRQGEVCGLLNSSDGRTSVFISSAAVRQCYQAARERIQPQDPEQPPDSRPLLRVFGSVSCEPCRRLKADYANDAHLRQTLNAAFQVQFVDVDKQPHVARRQGITTVPTFVGPNGLQITGYPGPEELLTALGLTPVAPEPPTQQTAEHEDNTETPDAEPAPASPSPAPAAKSTPPAADEPEPAIGIVARWLGITGATGGTAGLILGSAALWRTLRKRKQRQRPARDPPGHQQPAVVSVDTPAPPQAIVPETRFAPYERDTFAEAFAWAETELARKYPGSVGTLETLRGLIDQYLAAKGIHRQPPSA